MSYTGPVEIYRCACPRGLGAGAPEALSVSPDWAQTGLKAFSRAQETEKSDAAQGWRACAALRYAIYLSKLSESSCCLNSFHVYILKKRFTIWNDSSWNGSEKH